MTEAVLMKLLCAALAGLAVLALVWKLLRRDRAPTAHKISTTRMPPFSGLNLGRVACKSGQVALAMSRASDRLAGTGLAESERTEVIRAITSPIAFFTSAAAPELSPGSLAKLLPNGLATMLQGEPEAHAAPVFLNRPDGDFDDLKLIAGIDGPTEMALFSIGVFHHWQIAMWKPEYIGFLKARIPDAERIAQGNWREQARRLTAARLNPNT